MGTLEPDVDQHRPQQRERQAEDCARVTVDAVDEPAAEPVEGEATRYAQRLSCCYVRFDFGVRWRAEPHFGGCQLAPVAAVIAGHQHKCVSGVQDAVASAHGLPSFDRGRRVRGFSVRCSVELENRVAPQDDNRSFHVEDRTFGDHALCDR